MGRWRVSPCFSVRSEGELPRMLTLGVPLQIHKVKICLLKILLQDTLEIPKHLEIESHCLGRQMQQQVTTPQIVIRAEEAEK